MKLKKNIKIICAIMLILSIGLVLGLTNSKAVLTTINRITNGTLAENSETHSNFENVVIRKGDEYGEVVTDILNGDSLTIEPNVDYFLCISSNTPIGTTDGYFKITIAGEKANGLNYISIPGQTYNTGDISSDAFDKLLEYTDTAEVKYGSRLISYPLKDGTLKYSIKEAKMNGNETYYVFGFKMDDTVWNESEKEITNAISFEIGNSAGATDAIAINANINAKKVLYLNAGDNNINVVENIKSSAITVGLFSTAEYKTPVIYSEMGYKITYPKGAEFSGASYSDTSVSITNDTWGTISYSDEIDNGDGTLSRIVSFGPGKKSEGNSSTIVNNYITFTDSLKAGNDYKVKLSDGYYKPYGSDTKISLNVGNINKATSTYTAKLFSADTIVDRSTITAVNRTGSTAVYNWNLDSYTENDTINFMGGASLRNTDAITTPYAKTLKVNYNITDEKANISFVSIPVGVDENDNYLTSLNVKYTAIKSDGSLISGTYEISKIMSSGINRYVILRAIDLDPDAVSIKSIETDIGYLLPKSSTCTWYSVNSPYNNMLAAYGYFTDDTIGNRVKNTFVVSNTDSSAPTNDLKVTSEIESTNQVKVKFSTNFERNETNTSVSIVAGESYTLKNKNISVNYFLSNTNETVLLNPELYIIMPRGMSYEGLTIYKQVTNPLDSSRNKTVKLDIKTSNITYLNTTDDGSSIYHVTFKDKDLSIGNYCNPYADTVNLTATVTLNTTKTMTTKVYDFDSLFQLSGESKNISVTNYDSSYTQPNIVEDTYNINNGKTLSGTRAWNAKVTGISVQRLDAITVENAISVFKIDGKEVPSETRTWDIYDSTNQNSISYLGLNTEGQYRVIIQNPSTSDAENFKMFLPIPKANSNLGTNFMNNTNEFNMRLAADDVGDYKVTYVYIEEASDLGTTIDQIKYHETSESEANAILITKDIVSANETDTLYFNFKVTKDDSVKAGAFNAWRSYFNYQLEGNTISNNGSYVATEVAVCEVNGNIFEDANNNLRLDDGEIGLGEVSIVATDSLGRVQFATSDADGNYSFTNVREDNITISMEITNGNYWFVGEKKSNTEISNYNNVDADSSNPKKASADIYTSGDEVTVNASINKVYKITYDKNDASGTAPSAQELPYGEKGTVATPPSGMIQSGAEFIGWSKTKYSTATSNTDKVEYKAGDVITITEDITLYAVYIPKYYTLTFDLSGGTVTNGQVYDSKLVRSGYSLGTKDPDGKTFPNVSKDGYKFWKWEYAEGEYGKGDSIYSSSYLTITSDIMIRAVFLKLSKAEDTLNLTYGDTTTSSFYDLSDLSVDGLPGYYNYGIKYSLKEGQELPNGLSLIDGSIVGTASELINKDVVFVATAQVSSSGSTQKFEFTLHINIAKKDINLGLTSDPTGGIVATSEEQTVVLTSKITGLVDGTKVNENDEVTFVITDASNNEKTLGTAVITDGKATYNWKITDADIGTYKISTKIDSLVDEYNILNNQEIGSFVISEKPISKYTVKYNTDGYGFTLDDAEYVENTALGTLPNVKVTGYTFDGWYDIDNNKVDETTLVTSDMTLYAKYNAKTYIVNYEGLTKTISTPSKTDVKYSDANLIPTTPESITGYTFTKWQTSNGNEVTTETKYQDLASEDTSDITLYAVYEANTYTVTFNADGGTVSVNNIKIKYDAQFGALQVPTKSGYTFVGWYDPDDKEITSQTVYKYTTDITLIAKWSVKSEYKVKYSTLCEVTYDDDIVTWESLIDISKTPTRKGYIFKGWLYNNKLVNSTDTYGLLATNDKQETMTLTASWEQNKVTITLAYSSYKSSLTDEQVEVGELSEIGTIEPNSITGYAFDAWYYDKDYTKKVNSTDIIETDITIYPNYTVRKYKVSYKSNQVTINILDKENILYNDNNLLPLNVYEVPGYTFVKYTDKTGNEVTDDTKYSDLVTSDRTMEVSIYAVYKQNTYEVTYDAKEGTIGDASPTFNVTYNETYGTLVKPTTAGGRFANWVDKDNNVVTSSSIYRIADNSVLTAVYEYLDEYTVIFDTDGGNTIDDIETNWNADLNTLVANPTKKGYTFIGWMNNGIVIANDAKYSTIAEEDYVTTITLVAKWTRNARTVKVDYQSFDKTLENETINYNQYDQIGSISAKKITAYTFAGWYYDKDLTSLVKENDEVENNITIYPKYTVNKYTVKYTGVEIANKEDVLFDDNDLLPTSGTEKIGYTLDKFVDENGIEVTNITKYSDIVTDDSVTEITLEAIYTPNKYTITYDAKEGTIENKTKEVTYDSAIGTLEVPTVKGGKFVGWYDESGNQVNETDIYKTEGDILITAKYEYADEYKVIYEDLGEELNVNWNSLLTIEKQPTKDGYEFNGWLYNDTLINPTDTYGIVVLDDAIKEITLKAKWTEIPVVIYNIIFEEMGGTDVDDQQVIENNAIKSLPTPVKPGYEFKGWYVDATVTVPFDETTKITKDITLYAKWEYVYSYKFIEGDNQEFIIGEVHDYHFEIDGDYNKFVKLLVNSDEYERDVDYIASEGSTIINFVKAGEDKLNKLDIGVYPVELLYSDGVTVKGTLTIKEKGKTTDNKGIDNPQTSDNIVLYILSFIISSIGFIGTLIFKKNK